MQRDLPFHTGFGLVPEQITRAGGKPFGSAIQIFETFRAGYEVLMIVAGRKNHLVQVPIHRRPDEVVQTIEPPHISKVVKPDLIALLLVKYQRLLVRKFLVEFNSKIADEQIKNEFRIRADQGHVAIQAVVFREPFVAQAEREP